MAGYFLVAPYNTIGLRTAIQMLMYKLFLSPVIILLATLNLCAQNIAREFEIALPGYKVENSLYNTIRAVDSRAGDTVIGIINYGALRNIDAKLVMATSLQSQLTNVLNDLTDTSAKNGELLFQLNRFSFVETWGTRYCHLIATLYDGSNGGYKPLALLDTTLVLPPKNLSPTLTDNAGKLISDLIARRLLQHSKSSTIYSIDDVKHIDSIDMQKIPLYTATGYTDGIYKSFQSFAQQMPDQQGTIIEDGANISTVKIAGADGKKIKLKPADVYAVVYKGQPFIATAFGYYKLVKTGDNNFYFSGLVKKLGDSDDDNKGPKLGLDKLAGDGKGQNYIMMIDHRNGKLIHIRKIDAEN